jgi:dephospho-CoA kinase
MGATFFYLVGPTASGKSTLAEALAKEDQSIYHLRLDTMVRTLDPRSILSPIYGWGRFHRASIALITLAESHHKDHDAAILIDIGAGSLQTEAFYDFLAPRKQSLIYISAPPETVHQRAKLARGSIWATKSIDEFKASEYSPQRMRIYSLASHVVDNSGALEDAYRSFVEIVRPKAPKG